MYCLQTNVEIVSGAKRYCIYNLNTHKMFSMDFDDLRLINKILNEPAPDEHIPQELIRYLLAEGIITETSDLLPLIKVPQRGFSADFVWIEVTQNCNLLCRHCYEGSSRTECKPEISLEHFRLAVDTLKKMGVNHVQLVGGEPLMHSQIEQLISYAANSFSYVEIFTNGTLLTDRLLNTIKTYGASLALSVYAPDPAIHDKVTRTEGSFALTYKHIKNALSKGIEVRIASVEMKDIPQFSIPDLPVSHRTDFPRLTGRANLALYSRDMLKRKLITKENFKYPIYPDNYYNNKSIHNCFGERLYVDCNLNLYPCAMERRICYGNILDTPISEVMSNEFAKMTKDKITGCKDCEYRYACYDCRCDANNAPLNAKPWYCTYNQNEGVWIDVDQFIDSLLLQEAEKSWQQP